MTTLQMRARLDQIQAKEVEGVAKLSDAERDRIGRLLMAAAANPTMIRTFTDNMLTLVATMALRAFVELEVQTRSREEE